ncbi:hypothetical protein BH09BAC5_BH09BAC5_15970 [soil metagenome]
MKKTLLTLFYPLVICISTTLSSQTPSSTTVSIKYSITPDDSANKANLYASKFQSRFLTSDYQKQIELSAKRIRNQLNHGDTIYNIDPVFNMQQLFSSSLEVSQCRNLSREDFLLPAAAIGSRKDRFDDKFRIVNGNAVSQKITITPANKFILGYDTIAEFSGKKNKSISKVVPVYMDLEKSSSFFLETWNFDPMTGIFRKTVPYLGYFAPKFTNEGEMIGHTPKLCLENPNSGEINASDILFKHNVITDVATSYDMSQTISDTSHASVEIKYLNAYYEIDWNNIPYNDRAKFFASLFYYAINNPSTVFPVNKTVIDSLHPFQSGRQVEEMFHYADSTVQYEMPDNPGVLLHATVVFDLSMSRVYGLRFYEDWYYDPITLVMKKKVLGIGILQLDEMTFGGPYVKDSGIYIKVN